MRRLNSLATGKVATIRDMIANRRQVWLPILPAGLLKGTLLFPWKLISRAIKMVYCWHSPIPNSHLHLSLVLLGSSIFWECCPSPDGDTTYLAPYSKPLQFKSPASSLEPVWKSLCLSTSLQKCLVLLRHCPCYLELARAFLDCKESALYLPHPASPSSSCCVPSSSELYTFSKSAVLYHFLPLSL
jgi:hypothetical protein